MADTRDDDPDERRGASLAQAGQAAHQLAADRRLLLLAAYFLLPLFWLVVASTKSNDDLFSTFGLWFADFNLIDNLKTLFTAQDGIYLRWMANSFIYAIVSGVGAAFLATAAGYAFAKYKFPGSSAMFSIILGVDHGARPRRWPSRPTCSSPGPV